VVALDTETMGLEPHRDRLCLVQLSAGDGDAHLVHFPPNVPIAAPRLAALLCDPGVLKLFHYARFDVAVMRRHLGVASAPLFCTKIASRLCRTYTDRHGLKDLCKALLGVDLNKQMQTSDWGSATLGQEQIEYAAEDVLYLHRLHEHLDILLLREGRTQLAAACFAFVPSRAELDLLGWAGVDIFAHS